MSDYLAAQKTISAAFDTALEVMTPHMQKIQFNSSGYDSFERPNEIRPPAPVDIRDVELLFDGKTPTLYGKNINGYMELEPPGSVDQLIDTLRDADVRCREPTCYLATVYDR